jgi:hypothetical protein
MVKIRSLLCAVMIAAPLWIFVATSRAQNETTTAAAAMTSASVSASTSSSGAAPAQFPYVHHAPPSIASPNEALRIEATIDFPNLVKRAVLVYRAEGAPQLHEVPFLRGNQADYVAVIPAEDVHPPGVAYAIEVEQTDGARFAVFAQRDAMHDVAVPEDYGDLTEKALLAQVAGRRSVFSSSFDYVSFGSSATTTGSSTTVSDGYWRAEFAYTYRPLRFIVEFSIRAGIVRGTSPVPGLDPTAPDFNDKTKVGLNYGAPTALVRLTDYLHLEAELLTSVTEVGFSAGGGAAIHIGEVYGSKLVVGVESVKTFGTRGWARLDLVRPHWRVSPIVEITDMPHADRAGVRLLTELALDLGNGFGIAARAGYQARDFKTGGPALGVSMAYAF